MRKIAIIIAVLAAFVASSMSADSVFDPNNILGRTAAQAEIQGVSVGWMQQVISCEDSTLELDPIGAHGEHGPGQWLPSTWDALAPEPYRSMGIDDPDANIAATVWAHLNGLSGLWSCG